MSVVMGFSVRRLAGSLGAEIAGADLASIDDAGFAELRRLLGLHHVLFLPGQDLTPDAHRALGRRFGVLEVHPFIDKYDDNYPEVCILAADRGLIADVWHTDVTFAASPPMCSILHMVTCPPYGGDTMWTNQAAVFAALSPPLQEMLLGLTAVHSAAVFGQRDITAEHPVVRRHPDTGVLSLFVNRQFTQRIVQLHPDESESLLAFLYRFSEQPQFTVRYAWTPGAVGIWDNRITQHYVVNDFEGQRTLHRVTVLGDHPEPAGDTDRWPAWTPLRVSAAASGERR
jgi:taurine dioxygenase